MDRETLVLRNQTMADAYHATRMKHYLRRVLLRATAWLPIARQRPPEVERILLIRPDHLGDLLMTTPAFQALRRARPRAQLHALVGPWSAAALRSDRHLDQVLTLDFPGFQRGGAASLRSPYDLALHTARQLRRVGYSQAVIMRPDHWWGALVAFLAGIPIRIGYNHPDVAPFLTLAIEEREEHAVLKNLRLLESWTGTLNLTHVQYSFQPDEIDIQDAIELRRKASLTADQRYFCIHPGSGAWVKRWPAESWALVADTLAAQIDATPIFTGGDHEHALIAEIAEHMEQSPVSLAGQTDVAQLAALFQDALVVMGPDSGPLHLAAAVQTPTVALFGPADPVEFAPWGPPQRHIVLTSSIACRPCRVLDWGSDTPENHPCMREISIGVVLEAARRVVNT